MHFKNKLVSFKIRPELADRKGVVFHHDIAKPHTFLQSRQLLQLILDVLPHLMYSLAIARSDFHLFRS